MCFKKISKIIYPIVFQGTKVRLTSLYFLVHLEDRSCICFLSSSGAFPSHHDLSSIKEIVLVMTLGSSLSTHKCIPSGSPCHSTVKISRLQQGLLPSHTSTLFIPVPLLPSPHLIQGMCSLSASSSAALSSLALNHLI